MPQSSNELKRKRTAQPSQPSRRRKTSHAPDARIISTQTTGKAFTNGGVDVDKFVRAREYEIKALEDSLKRSKQALNARAFQSVPRDLRRRTASHNAKRVPKRLRARAVKEMRDDNTPRVNAKTKKKPLKLRLRLETARHLKELGAGRHNTKKRADKAVLVSDKDVFTQRAPTQVLARAPRIKKNSLLKPPIPKAKFRRRQIHKSWLPTHMFHAKRAHMTPPSQPLWRMAIPLSPTAKSYRPTHRAGSVRGGVAWDTSYMSTIQLEGTQASILQLFEDLGPPATDPRPAFGSKSIAGSRYWEGWLYSFESTKPLAPATVMWQALDRVMASSEVESIRRRCLIRVQPSGFFELWNEALARAKAQKPPVTLQDLRFEIGSIELTGPASTEVLVQALRPTSRASGEKDSNVTESFRMWDQLQNVTNPSLLPANIVIAMDVCDPRLSAGAGALDASTHPQVMKNLARWPLDNEPPASRLFDRSSRLAACRLMPSQKAINRRRSLKSSNGGLASRGADPSVPVLLFASRGQGRGLQGSWTLLLPWKYVLPFWYSLMYQRVSTGGTLRFGGLNEKRQIAFEVGKPWFPGDFPGTAAGWAWEDRESELRRKAWDARPKGKRIKYGSVNFGNGEKGEIGEGWACDWRALLKGLGVDAEAEQRPWQMGKRLAISIQTHGEQHQQWEQARTGVAVVKLQMLKGGVPASCARVYRLPASDKQLRSSWLRMLEKQPLTAPVSKRNKASYILKDVPAHVRRQHLAASLLNHEPLENDDSSLQHPPVPKREDLIGFVTAGNFNLGEGVGTGIGNILLRQAYVQTDRVADSALEAQLCIVRNAGQVTGRLARWELVE